MAISAHNLANLRHLYDHMVNGRLTTEQLPANARGLLGPAIEELERATTPGAAIARWSGLGAPPKVTRPTLTAYTEERYLRELRAISGLTEGEIQGALRRSRVEDVIVTPGGNSSFIGGLVHWCPQCDCMRVTTGPDSHAYQCRTCYAYTGGGNMAGLGMLFTPGRAPVAVKPLVWTVLPYPTFRLTYHTADTGHGRYYQVIAHDERPDDFRLWTEAKDMEDPPCGTVNGSIWPTLEAAKQAAQVEWQAFIRAAVEETPTVTHLMPSFPFLGRTDRVAPADGLHVGCRVVLKSGYGEYFQGGERGAVTALDASWVEVDCLPGIRFSRSYATPLS